MRNAKLDPIRVLDRFLLFSCVGKVHVKKLRREEILFLEPFPEGFQGFPPAHPLPNPATYISGPMWRRAKGGEGYPTSGDDCCNHRATVPPGCEQDVVGWDESRSKRSLIPKKQRNSQVVFK